MSTSTFYNHKDCSNIYLHKTTIIRCKYFANMFSFLFICMKLYICQKQVSASDVWLKVQIFVIPKKYLTQTVLSYIYATFSPQICVILWFLPFRAAFANCSFFLTCQCVFFFKTSFQVNGLPHKSHWYSWDLHIILLILVLLQVYFGLKAFEHFSQS